MSGYYDVDHSVQNKERLNWGQWNLMLNHGPVFKVETNIKQRLQEYELNTQVLQIAGIESL